MAPTLAQAVIFAESARSSSDVSTLTAALTSVAVNDVVVVKAQTWDTTAASGTPSGGSQSFTQRAIASPGGFAAYCRIFTAVMAAGVASSFTLTLSAPATGCYHNVEVEHWTTAQLAASPATNSYAYTVSSAPTSTITTTAANSIVSFCIADANSASPATDAYLTTSGTVTSEKLADYSGSGDGVYRHAYQTAVTSGLQTYGMATPATQKAVMVAVEIQAAAATGLVIPQVQRLFVPVHRASSY